MAKEVQAAILGTGSYVPEKKLTNSDLQKTLDTSDEWITTRTGIRCRRVVAPGEDTSDLSVQAAQQALDNAGMVAEDLDLILVATISPDYLMPSTAAVVQRKLGLADKGTGAFDVNAACSGFVYGVATAKGFVESGMARNVMVIGAEVLSRFLDYEDRSTCILFGDGAGACVVGPHREDGPSHPILSAKLFADGNGNDQVIIPGGGSVNPASHGTVDEKLHTIRVSGKEVFRFGVSKMAEGVREAIEYHQLEVDEIGQIVPHQANDRILESASKQLAIPQELFFKNLAGYGNTSGASVPLALDEAARDGKLPEGKHVILVGFGAGLTWAWAVVRW